MPTDIMTSTCRSEHYATSFRRTSATEVKSGFLVLSGPGGMRQDVRVVVYRTSLEHFAVIYPRKRLSKAIGVVNLRNTAVEQAEASGGFVVRQKGYDSAVSARFQCSARDVAAWLAAFARAAPPDPARGLPVLDESEES